MKVWNKQVTRKAERGVGNKIQRLKASAKVFCLAILTMSSLTTAWSGEPIKIKSRSIEYFKIGSTQKKFGNLEFVGGLEMTSSTANFGAWSGIALDTDQKQFIGIADTGFWFSGQIIRDNKGTPKDVVVSIQKVSGKSGKPITAKWEADAEGIAIRGNRVLVSFERDHRISTYEMKDHDFILRSSFLPPVPLHELRTNRGFEGIAYAPKASPIANALVGISEKSLDKAGNIMAFASLETGHSFEFSVARKDEFDITDIGFLENGDLVLLERRFNIKSGLAIRLRRVQGQDIKPGATIDGKELIYADMLYQIDNIEGLSITTDADGTPRLTLVSDDNHSLLQRNLLLEFRLIE